MITLVSTPAYAGKGLTALIAGTAFHSPLLGAAGFIAMLVGVYSETSQRRSRERLTHYTHPKRRRSLNEIAEERWRRRNET